MPGPARLETDVPRGRDCRTPEQSMPRTGVTVDGRPVSWETCQSFSGLWGTDRDASTRESFRQLVELFLRTP